MSRYGQSDYDDLIHELDEFLADHKPSELMREPVKTKFTLDDLDDSETFEPCKYCHSEEWWPVCEDGATSSSCNHCAYNIITYCRDHFVEE